MQDHVDAGDPFLIATVGPKQHGYRHGRALLPPLRFEYDARALALPLEVGRANVPGSHDLTILVLAPTRYVVRNRPEVTIPSGLALREQGAEQFVQFNEALFTATACCMARLIAERYPPAQVHLASAHAVQASS